MEVIVNEMKNVNGPGTQVPNIHFLSLCRLSKKGK